MAEIYNAGGVVCKTSGNDIVCSSSIPGAADGCKESGSTKTCCTSGKCVSTTVGVVSSVYIDPTSPPSTDPVVTPVVNPDSTRCDCGDMYTNEMNALIAKRNKGEDVRDELGKYIALRAECVKRCSPAPVPVVKKKKEEKTVALSKSSVRDKRRVVYSSSNI